MLDEIVYFCQHDHTLLKDVWITRKFRICFAIVQKFFISCVIRSSYSSNIFSFISIHSNTHYVFYESYSACQIDNLILSLFLLNLNMVEFLDSKKYFIFKNKLATNWFLTNLKRLKLEIVKSTKKGQTTPILPILHPKHLKVYSHLTPFGASIKFKFFY
ncbi:hypothetical protein BpHYR1_011277 [Brachionus plicatilis]|uniref:Uncharacterized protein n=1 Tax=Brachionus plicatilis TaxID=10195 RepID=A0A3M7QTA3_BRAPC|nr:hypothetical protein BpHYR1_011277 [Brachionus plicatilis]